MIKEILEQLAPLDAQIAALKGRGNDMEAITAHASELAELAVEEDEILRTCGPLTAEDDLSLDVAAFDADDAAAAKKEVAAV